MTEWVIAVVGGSVGALWVFFVAQEYRDLREKTRRLAAAEQDRSCQTKGPPVPPGEKS